MIPKILIIAGSDSGGGAGIQADIKTVTTLGGYATTAITAITAQNTTGVKAIHPIPAEMVALQARVVLDDIGADCIKIGMLQDQDIIHAVANVLKEYPDIPLVIDPVMVAKDGSSLLKNTATKTLVNELFPLATIITPNIPEAESLLDIKIENVKDMKQAVIALKEMTKGAVFLKGGHLEADHHYDIYYDGNEYQILEGRHINTTHTHGTGCTMASAIATLIGKGYSMEAVLQEAKDYITTAIRHAPGFGSGKGPINHLAKDRLAPAA